MISKGMASSSCLKQGSVPMNIICITPEATYKDVVADPKLFMSSLERLHSLFGTKLMVPIIGGRDLDLHKLFIEVTSRGGINKILNENRWQEVFATFVYPKTMTNASYVIRKFYLSLLKDYEQIYYFKSHGKIPPGSLTSTLVSVTIGSKQFKGVLYQLLPHNTIPQQSHANPQEITSGVSKRRSRRKKSKIKRHDLAHQKKQWVYQEKAMENKETHQTKTEDYKEKLKTKQLISNIDMSQEGDSSSISGESEPHDDQNGDHDDELKEPSLNHSCSNLKP